MRAGETSRRVSGNLGEGKRWIGVVLFCEWVECVEEGEGGLRDPCPHAGRFRGSHRLGFDRSVVVEATEYNSISPRANLQHTLSSAQPIGAFGNHPH